MIRPVSIIASLSLLLLCSFRASAQLQEYNNPDSQTPKSTPSVQKPSYSGESEAVVALRSARYIFVKSTSLLVGRTVIEEKLQKRTEFSKLGLTITRDEAAADVVLEVHHDVFTKYVYIAVDPKRNIVVAGGKLSSLGGTVAGKVAKRFLKQMIQARATGP